MKHFDTLFNYDTLSQLSPLVCLQHTSAFNVSLRWKGGMLRVVSFGHWKVLLCPWRLSALFFIIFFSFSTSTSLCNDIFRINYHLLKGVSSCRHIFSPPTSWVVIWNLDFLKQILIFISYASSAWFGSARLGSALSLPAGVRAEATCGACEPRLSLDPPSVHPPKHQVGFAINKPCPPESVDVSAFRQLGSLQWMFGVQRSVFGGAAVKRQQLWVCKCAVAVIIDRF